MAAKQSKPTGVMITPAMLGVMVAAFTLIAGVWKVGTAIATKSDVDSIKAALTTPINDHELRIRGIERQLDRYFGASQTGAHQPVNQREDVETFGRVILAQYAPPPNVQQYPPAYSQAAPPPVTVRRAIVPLAMIQQFDLQPTRGGTYAVAGEDGRSYSLDDVLYILIRLHFNEQLYVPQNKAAPPRMSK